MKELKSRLLDNCEVCHGRQGGVRGNENIIEGVIVCDYCHVLLMNFEKAKERNRQKGNDV